MIDGTKASCHCYHVKLDGNRRPVVRDLVRSLCDAVVDYAIPRQQVAEAAQRFAQTGSTDHFSRLAEEARSLFTDQELTGEGGELLLFLFAERLLKLPQLFSKMYLKTSTRKHYEGSDAIHAGVNPEGRLTLHWGESKIYSHWRDGITQCFSDLSPFLRRDDNRDTRDIQLIRQYIDIGDKDLQEAILAYLDPTSPQFLSAEYCGLAMTGFTADSYAAKSGMVTPEAVLENVMRSLADWKTHTRDRILHELVHEFTINMFVLPFPSADDFRTLFRKQLGL
jgi:hypothetical protein